MLRDYLIDNVVSGLISSRAACTIAYWAVRAGANSPDLTKLQYRPDAQSGHFARHIDSVLGTKTVQSRFYTLPIPGYSRSTMSRSVLHIPVAMPYKDARTRPHPLSPRLPAPSGLIHTGPPFVTDL